MAAAATIASQPPAAPAVDPERVAKDAGLRYMCDTMPGIRRERAGDGFRYRDTKGAIIDDPELITRIKKLAIPPAWTDVWISPRVNGHLQATGRDQRGRKQYRYHARWREVRDEAKYDRMLAFGQLLPRIRARIEEDLARPGLTREKVLATVLRLMEATLIRIGNDEYAKANESYGLTTLRNEHVDVAGARVRFTFRGKSGKEHSIDVRDRRLASIVRRIRDLEGYDMFQYVDDNGAPVTIGSGDVNAYLREVTQQDFTAKDFRTWGGTLLAATALAATGPAESITEAKRNVNGAVATVAARLGNTPAISRKCYVHPAVMDAYLEGEVIIADADEDKLHLPLNELVREERALLRLLKRRAVAS